MTLNKRGVVAAGLAAAVAAILSSAAGAGADQSLAGSKVDNFMLPDQTGMGHELYYYNANPAIVLVTSRTAIRSPSGPPGARQRSARRSRARTCSS
jgi:hypothetical protein